MRKLILVDLDNTFADFDQGVVDLLKKCFPFIDEDLIRNRNIRNIFDFCKECYVEEVSDKALQLMKFKSDFYLNLKPMHSNLKVKIQEISKYHNIVGCGQIYANASLERLQSVIYQKRTWLAKNIGGEFASKSFLIQGSKSQIAGDYLIDDIADLGDDIENKSWEHIIYPWRYNSHRTDKFSYSWNEPVEKLLDKINDDLKSQSF